jgi:hypothetical protein
LPLFVRERQAATLILRLFFRGSDELLWCRRRFVTGIGRSSWLDQEKMRFFFCERLVFNAAWHHKQFSWTQHHIAITQMDGQASLENQKEVIRIVMFVPNKFALNLEKRASFSARLMLSFIGFLSHLMQMTH